MWPIVLSVTYFFYLTHFSKCDQLLQISVPLTLNQKADYYSKVVDYDWCVFNGYFCEAVSRWGPFSKDCFASHATTKLPRFSSRFYSPNP